MEMSGSFIPRNEVKTEGNQGLESIIKVEVKATAKFERDTHRIIHRERITVNSQA